MRLLRRSARLRAAMATAVASVVLGVAVPAYAAPPAPKPTSTAASPGAPDPHPPLGGQAPDGSVPGGPALLSRGLVLPANAPKLPKDITAKAWMLTDLDTGQILAARDPHGRYQPASVLKLLTSVTVLPNLPGSRQVTVSTAAAGAEGSAVGLLAGAKYSVDQLFQALLLVSANDAAAAIAEANGGVAKTVADMNAEAQALGAYDTYVQTPSGLDGWQQLTSAYDLTLVLRAAVNTPRLLAYDKEPLATFPPKKSAAGKVGRYEFDNQSQAFLSTYPGALLAKIGYTDAALHTYAAAAEQKGRRLGVIFLRGQRTPVDQDVQAERLLSWGFGLHSDVAPVGTLVTPPVVQTAAPPLTSAPAPGTRPASGPVAGSDPARTRSTASAAPGSASPSAAISAHVDATASRVALAASSARSGHSDLTKVAIIAALGIAAAVAVRLRRPRRPPPRR